MPATTTPPARRGRPTGLVVAIILALVLTACGSSGEGGTATGVASLEDVVSAAAAVEPDAADGAEETEAVGDLSIDEAVLEFSACMRDEGVDFPDIGIDADGNPDIRDAFDSAGISPRDEDVRAAMGECRTILEGVGFGGGGRAGLADNVEVQDALVEFSDCVRDDGWDVGDLELGGRQAGADTEADAGETPEAGGGERPENAEGGERQDGFGNRTARFARGLGLDPQDPAVQATMEKCEAIVTEALAAAGVGRN